MTDSVNFSLHINKTMSELEQIIEEEKREALKLQRQITAWENKIRENFFQMGRNAEQIKQRTFDHLHLTIINKKLIEDSESLRSNIANLHALGVEPIQDGVLFLKEFGIKLKSLEKQETPATFEEMKAWAENHLDHFLKKYPSVPHRVVSVFRRFTTMNHNQ